MRSMVKTFCALFCALTVLIGAIGVLPASAISGGGPGTGSIVAWGCDMSYYNTEGATDYSLVNYSLMKADGCEYVILRIGFEGSASRQNALDKSFVTLYNMAREAGMGIGLYFYSLATTYSGAVEDAEWVIDIIESNGMYFEYPLYYDVEDSNQTSLGSTAMTSLCLGWCETLENAGYFGGIYGGKTQVMDKLSSDFLSRYDTWIAVVKSATTGSQYDPTVSNTSFRSTYGMWQYKWYNYGGTQVYDGAYWQDSYGYPLDCNVAFKDYPTIMSTYGWNNCSNATSAERLGTYKVTTSSLNVRSGADTSYDIVGELTAGDLVVVTELSGNWGKITLSDGTEGWCSIVNYGDYIGIDALNTALTAAWNPQNLSYKTNSNGSVTFTNLDTVENMAVDMPLPVAIGTRTTPYLNISVSRHTGGWYFGLTEANSGYFMMRECTSGDQLVQAQSATFMQTDEVLQIDLSEWWQPADGWRINDLRLYLDPGASVTVNYCYFADEADVVTSTAYNTRVKIPDPIDLMLPSTLSIPDRTKTGSYTYQNGTLTVVSGEENGYEVSFSPNASYSPEELSQWIFSVDANVRFDIELLVTTSDGDRIFSLRDDFYNLFTDTPDGDYIPAMTGSAALDILSCYTYNNVLPTDGISTIKTVTVRVGGVGTVVVNEIQIAANDVLTDFTDTVTATDSTPDANPDPDRLMGDVNGDGTVTTVDARAILMHVLGSVTLTAEQQVVADYDGNGEIATADVRAILKVLTA